jgi:hypothetical protein
MFETEMAGTYPTMGVTSSKTNTAHSTSFSPVS